MDSCRTIGCDIGNTGRYVKEGGNVKAGRVDGASRKEYRALQCSLRMSISNFFIRTNNIFVSLCLVNLISQLAIAITAHVGVGREFH